MSWCCSPPLLYYFADDDRRMLLCCDASSKFEDKINNSYKARKQLLHSRSSRIIFSLFSLSLFFFLGSYIFFGKKQLKRSRVHERRYRPLPAPYLLQRKVGALSRPALSPTTGMLRAPIFFLALSTSAILSLLRGRANPIVAPCVFLGAAPLLA